MRDLVVLDGGFEVLDLDRLDASDGLGSIADSALCGILPALVRLRQHLDDFERGHLIPPEMTWLRSHWRVTPLFGIDAGQRWS